MFRIAGHIDLARGRPALVIPVFSAPGDNTPYVQVTGEFHFIEKFAPYYAYEEYDFVPEQRTYIVEVGEPGYICFRTPSLNIFVGGIDAIFDYVKNFHADIEQCPLLKMELMRLTVEPLAQQYQVWQQVAKTYFRTPRQQRMWLENEVTLHQSSDKIWKQILRDEEVPQVGKSYIGMSDFEKINTEELIAVLSQPRYYDCVDWSTLWLELASRLPFDERVYSTGGDWLYYIFSSDVDIVRGKIILIRIISFMSTAPVVDQHFGPFVLELLESGVWFSEELNLPQSALMNALMLVRKHVSDIDYLTLLITLLDRYYFSPDETLQLFAELSSSFASTEDFHPLMSTANDRTRVARVINKIGFFEDNEIAEGLKKKLQSVGLSVP